MSSLRTLARPYARAAVDLARGAGALAPWHEALQSAALLVADPASREWLDNPRLSVEQQAALFLPPGEQLDSAFGRFLLLMSENGRLSLLPEISDLFAELRAEAERTLTVRVRTAAAIDPVQEQMLTGALARRFDRAVELAVEVEPDLLGGAIIDAGDVVIDGSLRTRLERLGEALRS